MERTSARQRQVLIAGGGAGGLAVAAALKRARPGLDIALVEPSEQHYYQPGWTLVGSGDMAQSRTVRAEAGLIPEGVAWIRDRVSGFDPEHNRVTLEAGGDLGYDYLVVALGLQLDWGAVDGLEEALGHGGVTSNYRFDLAPYTWECIRAFRGGRALFTQPAMPIKCAGAPQKILYLAADHWRRHGVPAELHFFNQGAAMFGVPLFAKALEGVMAEYGATAHFGHDLIAVDGARREATFAVAGGDTVIERYDLLHVTPPQSAPGVIKRSPLAGPAGWMEVDRHSLRHRRFDNVFGLGDCTDTPNAKTAAAVRRQFPVVAGNLLASLDAAAAGGGAYDGYGGCPLPTCRGKVLLAEFRYDGEVVPSFNADPCVPRRSYWWLKRHFFPYLYWEVMLRGRDWRHPLPKPRPDKVRAAA